MVKVCIESVIYSLIEQHYKLHNNSERQVILVLLIYFRCKYLEHLNLSGLDEHSTPPDYNDFMHRLVFSDGSKETVTLGRAILFHITLYCWQETF